MRERRGRTDLAAAGREDERTATAAVEGVTAGAKTAASTSEKKLRKVMTGLGRVLDGRLSAPTCKLHARAFFFFLGTSYIRRYISYYFVISMNLSCPNPIRIFIHKQPRANIKFLEYLYTSNRLQTSNS